MVFSGIPSPFASAGLWMPPGKKLPTVTCYKLDMCKCMERIVCLFSASRQCPLSYVTSDPSWVIHKPRGHFWTYFAPLLKKKFLFRAYSCDREISCSYMVFYSFLVVCTAFFSSVSYSVKTVNFHK